MYPGSTMKCVRIKKSGLVIENGKMVIQRGCKKLFCLMSLKPSSNKRNRTVLKITTIIGIISREIIVPKP
jgi:hypothetical protein